jgi:glucan phosphoethanolaminetransferase (alkaline phosphatase superfamily)
MLPAGLLFLVDALLRHQVVARFTRPEILVYAGSALCSVFLFQVVHSMLFRARRRGRGFLSAGILFFALGYAVSTFLSYGFYFTNGILPNLFTFEFIRREPLNSWILLKDTVRLWHLPVFALTLAAFLSVFTWLSRRPAGVTRKGLLAPLAGLAVLLLVFSHNIQFYDQCILPDVANLSASARHAANSMRGQSLWGRGLAARNPAVIRTHFPSPGFHVVLIVTESLRRKSLGLYGHHRNTTPFQSQLASGTETFVFERAFSNATSTFLSLPGILNGVSPAQPATLGMTSPLLFEYAKAAGASTYFISSQRMNWAKLSSYLKSPALDVFWSYEDSGAPLTNDFGIDDRITVETWKKTISQMQALGKQSAGVLHFNTNHYPYHTEKEFSVWTGSNEDLYDNTVLKQDYLVRDVFAHLRKIGALDNTVVIFTSDHGEAFGEHGCIAHFYCHYQETVAIPLWIYIPQRLQNRFSMDNLRKARRANVSNLDIVPTALTLFGIQNSQEIQRLTASLPGQSLFETVDENRPIIITNSNETMRTDVGMSLIRGNLQYILKLSTRPPTEELYDFVQDPAQTRNLWQTIGEEQRNSILAEFLLFSETAEVLGRARERR